MDVALEITHVCVDSSRTVLARAPQMYILSVLIMCVLLIAADFGSRSRQSSTKMSRESSAGEPKVKIFRITCFSFFTETLIHLSLCLCHITKTDYLQSKGASSEQRYETS